MIRQRPSTEKHQAGAAFAARSLDEVFRRRAEYDSDRVAFTFLDFADEGAEHRTYAELDRQARAVAAHLQQVAAPGDRALLMFDAGFDYIVALAGCLYAGVVAVPVYPPDPMRAARTLPRLEAIVADAEAKLLLGTSSDLAWAGALLTEMPALKTLVPSDTIDLGLSSQWKAPSLDEQSPAFLQYTSGSTSAPKGVVIRHGNVLANLAQMENAFDVDNAAVSTWLPAYHDMGLVGGILLCWYSGRRNVMLSPLAFFQQPLRWLRAIDEYDVTTIAAPDFAYDLCVRKIKPAERATLDLSSLRVALSGAEPVRAATIDRFVETFAACGVRREIFCPCYGMAEATLMITASPVDEQPTVTCFDGESLSRNVALPVDESAADGDKPAASPGSAIEPAAAPHHLRLVGCGHTPAGLRLLIVDPQTRNMLGPRQVGEIWAAGPNIAREYWGQPDASRETFAAYTADGAGPFLRTGDLGFLEGGELFVSGRLKDLIIVRGRNYYPQDIEQTVEACAESLKSHAGAAFAVEVDGREQTVVAFEVTRPNKIDLEALCLAIRKAVLEAHDLVLDAVVLLRGGTIPKTSSGKIQRHACREQYARGELDSLYVWRTGCGTSEQDGSDAYVAPRNETEELLARVWTEVLGVERVGIFDNFFDLGGSSLLATQLVSRLSPQFGVEIPLAELFDTPTIASLAELIVSRRAAEDAADSRLLDFLEGLSDEEAQALLGRESGAQRSAVPAPNGTANVPANGTMPGAGAFGACLPFGGDHHGAGASRSPQH